MLSRGQREVLASLRKTAGVAMDKGRYGSLPVKPRTHVLVCGPSGVGKSHLCRELGRELGVAVLVLNCSSWQLMGGRSGKYTWDEITGFLDGHGRGIIVLDEIDKISGGSDWQGHLRLEIHDLLDGVIPPTADIPFKCMENDLWGMDEQDAEGGQETGEAKRQLLESRLKDNFLVVGAGAWQHLWQASETRNMGFMPASPQASMTTPTQAQLQSSLYPEILKRFQSKIQVIPPMTREDYLEQVAAVVRTLEAGQASRLQKKASETLERALQSQQGMRWIEELVLDALMNPEPNTRTPGSGVMVADEIFTGEFLSRFEKEKPESVSQEDFAAGFKTF